MSQQQQVLPLPSPSLSSPPSTTPLQRVLPSTTSLPRPIQGDYSPIVVEFLDNKALFYYAVFVKVLVGVACVLLYASLVIQKWTYDPVQACITFGHRKWRQEARSRGLDID